MTSLIFAKASAMLAVGILASSPAWAYDVVDTQVPAGSLIGSDTLDANDWLAQRFSVAGATHIDSVWAYVLSSDSAADLGGTFTIALYGNSAAQLPALDWNQPLQGKLYQATATYQGDGWNGLSQLDWTLPSGSYWLAIEQDGGGANATSLQLPIGALPVAQGVAFYAGGAGYAGTASSETFGLRITGVSAVPEPGAWALCLGGLALVVAQARRRQA